MLYNLDNNVIIEGDKLEVTNISTRDQISEVHTMLGENTAIKTYRLSTVKGEYILLDNNGEYSKIASDEFNASPYYVESVVADTAVANAPTLEENASADTVAENVETAVLEPIKAVEGEVVETTTVEASIEIDEIELLKEELISVKKANIELAEMLGAEKEKTEKLEAELAMALSCLDEKRATIETVNKLFRGELV